jgi:hypothetical protein
VEVTKVALTLLLALAFGMAGCGEEDGGSEGGTSRSGDQSAVPERTGRGPKPVLASGADLRKWSSSAHPIYWAGRRAGTRYEATRGKTFTFVRYLGRDMSPGARSMELLTVGSFQKADALASLTRLAKRNPAYASVKLRNGGLAVFDRRTRRLVHFSYPGSRTEVQVFDPTPGAARRLIVRGRIRPIG